VAGSRRLLRFATETRNIGTADLFLGSPIGSPLFEFTPCHGHYHFRDFADYRLVNSGGMAVAAGNKVGFCLEDVQRWNTNWSAAPRYDCTDQGIQAGWADIYNSLLPCQWIDITGLAAGVYTLEMAIDPNNRLAESNESNNVTRTTVVIDAPCSQAPANDDFSARRIVSNRIETAIDSNRCATKEGGEPRHVGNNGGSSIWYQWTAPYSGPVVITTDGSSFDTLLAVYRGSNVNDLTLVANNDDGGEGVASRVTFAASSNTVYQIAVDGYSGAEGGVALNVNPDGNDHFTNCLVISGNAGSITARNIGATREAGEPNHADNVAIRSVWFCWTATNSSPVLFDTTGSNFDTVLAVYTGGLLGNLAAAASDNDSGSNRTSRVIFNAVAGTTYHLAVDGVSGAAGIFTLNWRPVTEPYFNSITLLSSNTFRLTLSGQVGQRYAVETSGYLASWAPLLRITNLTGTVQFTDTVASNIAQRFYRAILLP
jgi:hypothetical protein